ncbi:hypothetical protein Tco_1275637 [Tanacetum coccineum]
MDHPEQCDSNTTLDSSDMSNNGGEADQDEQKFQEERFLLASLIEQMKCGIDANKKIDKYLESSNKVLQKANTSLGNELERDNSANMVVLDSDKTIRLAEESRSKTNKTEVIEFGDSYKALPEETCKGLAGEGSAKKKGRIVAITAEDMQKQKNDVKTRTTLLLALPDEYQLRFSRYDTAKELWEAILKTFGGNEATKKTKKNQLKQQYGNFKAEGSETLEQTLNRLQAIVSHLEFMDVPIEQDDLNHKFLTSLAPEWLVYTIVWRNMDDLDTMSLDDVYNHLKVYEPKVQKRARSNSQNMAFISSSNTSSGKSEVPTIQGFSTASG